MDLPGVGRLWWISLGTLAALLLAIGLGLALPWRVQQARGAEPPVFAPRHGNAARGQRVFGMYCQHCHGEGGRGGGCPDLGGLRTADGGFLTVWITNPQMINPTSPMPRVDMLRPEDVQDLVAYLKSL